MDVPKNKIGLEGEERIDVLNIKCDPVMIGSLLMNDGYLPAYHMHKGRWISIILNGTVLCSLNLYHCSPFLTTRPLPA